MPIAQEAEQDVVCQSVGLVSLPMRTSHQGSKAKRGREVARVEGEVSRPLMASQHLIRPFGAAATTHRNSNSLLSTPSVISLSTLPQLHRLQGRSTTLLAVRAKGKKQETTAPQSDGGGKNPQNRKQEVEEEIEVEEDLPWIQEKALDLVEFSGTVTQAIPGPRVGQSPLPWLLAIPLAYVGLSFVIAVVKTVRKFTSPREKRKKLVNKNAMLCKSIDELFQRGGDALQHSALKGLMQKVSVWVCHMQNLDIWGVPSVPVSVRLLGKI
ncbi:hypothetical protein ACLOJK_014290 [Asimina triloba]